MGLHKLNLYGGCLSAGHYRKCVLAVTMTTIGNMAVSLTNRCYNLISRGRIPVNGYTKYNFVLFLLRYKPFFYIFEYMCINETQKLTIYIYDKAGNNLCQQQILFIVASPQYQMVVTLGSLNPLSVGGQCVNTW